MATATPLWHVDYSHFFPGGETDGYGKNVTGKVIKDAVKLDVWKAKGSSVPAVRGEDGNYYALMTGADFNFTIQEFDHHMRKMLAEAVSASEASMRREMLQDAAVLRREVKREMIDAIGGGIGPVKAEIAQMVVDMEHGSRDRDATIADISASVAQSMEIMTALHDSLRAHHATTCSRSIQCLRPGCGKPTWNGNANDWCTTSCRNVPLQKKTEFLKQAIANFTRQVGVMDATNVQMKKELRRIEVAIYGRSAANRQAQRNLQVAQAEEENRFRNLQLIEAAIRGGSPGVNPMPARAMHEEAKQKTQQCKTAIGQEIAKDREISARLPEQDHFQATMTEFENRIMAQVLTTVKQPVDVQCQYMLQMITQFVSRLEQP